jgi:predicted RNA-binding Zn-ribbon protein involved in translation (DUF1610 family)
MARMGNPYEITPVDRAAEDFQASVTDEWTGKVCPECGELTDFEITFNRIGAHVTCPECGYPRDVEPYEAPAVLPRRI